MLSQNNQSMCALAMSLVALWISILSFLNENNIIDIYNREHKLHVVLVDQNVVGQYVKYRYLFRNTGDYPEDVVGMHPYIEQFTSGNKTNLTFQKNYCYSPTTVFPKSHIIAEVIVEYKVEGFLFKYSGDTNSFLTGIHVEIANQGGLVSEYIRNGVMESFDQKTFSYKILTVSKDIEFSKWRPKEIHTSYPRNETYLKGDFCKNAKEIFLYY